MKQLHRCTGIIGCFAVLMCAACTPSRSPVQPESVIAIQSTLFSLQCQGDSGAGVLFLNLHRDEWTGLEAAARVGVPGQLCWLEHPGGRNVHLRRENGIVSFDPNRMFSDVGLEHSMTGLSDREAPAATVAEVRHAVEKLTEAARLKDRAYVIALHNNTDERYSALSYLPGAEYAQEADTVYLAPEGDPDDFFFVTDRRTFELLSGRTYAVVLQANSTATDDGSLSVYAATHGVRYVNVEAEHGHVDVQAAMLRQLIEALDLSNASESSRK